jgi:hypothetical protein
MTGSVWMEASSPIVRVTTIASREITSRNVFSGSGLGFRLVHGSASIRRNSIARFFAFSTTVSPASMSKVNSAVYTDFVRSSAN